MNMGIVRLVQQRKRVKVDERKISKRPIALQPRYLQTMREMASEHNTTTFLLLPIDLFSAFLKK